MFEGRTSPAADGDLVVDIVAKLVAELRKVDVPVSSGESIDAARALGYVGLETRSDMHAALKATLIKDAAHGVAFDYAFDRLLPRLTATSYPSASSTEPGKSNESDATAPTELSDRLLDAIRAHDDDTLAHLAEEAIDRWGGLDEQQRGGRHHTARVLRGIGLEGILRQLLATNADQEEIDRRLAAENANRDLRALSELVESLIDDRLELGRPLQGATESIDVTDDPIMGAGPAELAALRKALHPLARTLAARLARRKRRSRGQLDMRRTIRANMGCGGVPLRLVMRGRHPSRPQLAVLCDVSGSVAEFAPFAFSLLYAVHTEFNRVRSWVFIDGAAEITAAMEESQGELRLRALRGHPDLVTGDGRSDHAAAFQAFLTSWPDALTPATTVLVIGDTRNHDRAPALSQLAAIRQGARRVYWFNPEPASRWDVDDSAASAYAGGVDAMYEVATLRQLTTAVLAIA